MAVMMNANPAKTLSEVIAEGERLLAGTRCRAARVDGHHETSPAVVVPQQALAGDRVTPTPNDEWLTPDDIALHVGWDPWTVDEHLDRGTLHGHDESGQWRVRGRVAEAFLQGQDPSAQRRVCGCRALRLVRGTSPGGPGGDGALRRRRRRW